VLETTARGKSGAEHLGIVTKKRRISAPDRRICGTSLLSVRNYTNSMRSAVFLLVKKLSQLCHFFFPAFPKEARPFPRQRWKRILTACLCRMPSRTTIPSRREGFVRYSLKGSPGAKRFAPLAPKEQPLAFGFGNKKMFHVKQE
jgi:hypothetical protein